MTGTVLTVNKRTRCKRDCIAGRYYLADRGHAAATPPVPPRIDIINTRSLKLLDLILTHAAGNGVVAIRTRRHGDEPRFTHWVAADSETSRIFVPISGVGVKVHTDNEEEDH